ncbi:MAG: hypothetical protein AAGD09_03260 [Cyanobacteria bacterium P01_F01_bin.56]
MATVSGTRIDIQNGYTTILSGSVSGAVAGDRNNSNRLSDDDAGDGDIVGWATAFSAIDLTSGQILFLFTTANLTKELPGRIRTPDLDGLFVLIQDGSGNHKSFVVGGAGSNFLLNSIAALSVFAEGGTTNTNGSYESGTVDWSNIVRFELYATKSVASRMTVDIDFILFIDNAVLTGTGGSMSDYIEFVNIPGFSLDQSQTNFLLPASLTIGDGGTTATEFNLNGTDVLQGLRAGSILGDDFSYYGQANEIEFGLNLGTGDTIDISRAVFKSPVSYQIDWSQSGSPAVTNPSTNIFGLDVDLVNQSFVGGSFVSCPIIDSTNCSFDGRSFDGCGVLNTTAGDTFTGCSFINSTGDGIVFVAAPGNYSTLDIRFNSNTGTADLTIDPSSAGTFDFSGLSVASGYTLKIKNASATIAITVQIGAGIATSTSTAGGAITIAAPTLSITFQNAPIGAALSVWDDEDEAASADHGTQLFTTTPDGTDKVWSSGVTAGNRVIVQWIPSSPFTLKEINFPYTVPSNSTNFDFTPLLQSEDGI